MNTCRNVLEELVIEEAKLQISRLATSARDQFNLSEVAAYALNRLPPMYATTNRGWLQQKKRASTELKHEIANAVKRAMLGVRRDALREVGPLPQSELEDQARSLAKLQVILGKEDLKWKEVPAAVEEALMTVKLKGAVSYTYLSSSRRSAVDIQEYLRRSKVGDVSWKTTPKIRRSTQEERNVQEIKDFASYMSTANYSFSNTLESLVRSVVGRQMQRLEPSLVQTINTEEVVAYALNRLPPMYATSDRGFAELRNRAKSEYAKDIMLKVREAVSTVLKAPPRMLPPLPFRKYEIEQEHALQELQEILRVTDLNWQNVAEVVEDALQRTLNGEIIWHRPQSR